MVSEIGGSRDDDPTHLLGAAEYGAEHSTADGRSSPSDEPFTVPPAGSISVSWDGSALPLVAVAANSGYDAELEEQTSSRIRVRFRGGVDSCIEVRGRDGKVELTISWPDHNAARGASRRPW